MSDAATPMWIKTAPGLSAAHKFMLSVLWGYGPYRRDELWIKVGDDFEPREPARCWETCPKLAELTGQTPATVRSQLRKLAAEGWIRRDGGTMRILAWRAPGVFAYGALATSHHPPVIFQQGDSSPPPGYQSPPPGDTSPPRVATSHPHNFQEHSNLTSNDVEDVRACATPSPEGEKHAHEQGSGNHPRTPGAPRHVGGGHVVGRVEATTANPHLTDTAPRHAALAAARAEPDNRADLSPEVDAVVRAARMGGQLLGVTWRKCLLEALDDIGVPVLEHAAMVTKVLEHWHASRPADKPAKSQVWYRRWRHWQRAAMGLGESRWPENNGMNGGIVAARPLPDWDKQDRERRAAR